MIKDLKMMKSTLFHVTKLLWNSSKFYFCGLFFANIFAGCLLSVEMIFWKNIINAVQEAFVTGSITIALYWLVAYMFLEVFQRIMEELCQYYKNILSSSTNKYITKLILEKTKDISMEKYDNAALHNKLKKANEESTGRSMNLLYSTGLLIKGLSVLISTAFILIHFNVPIMIICLVINIPTLLIGMRIASKQYEIYDKRFENIRFMDYTKTLLTKHENIKEVKVYGVTEYFINFLDKSYKTYIDEDKVIRKWFSIKIIGASFVESVVIYMMKAFICMIVIINKMTIGDLTLYISAIDNFKNAISNILSVMTSIFEDGLYVNNFFELICMGDESADDSHVKFDGCFQTIRFENVWFQYPDTEGYILENLNIEIEKGKTYAIVGLNGSGKTTILKLILRLYNPQKGNIYIDDYNINDIEINDYYKYVAAVFQDFIKYPLAIKHNIGLGNVSNMENERDIQLAAKKSGILPYINTLTDGFNTKLQKEWTGSIELSLGQWQKLAISRAFFKDAPIMILDEPTASLDPLAEHEISMNIKALMKDKTCILIAHRFSTVRLADKIYVLKAGTIVESGTHNELINFNGEYFKLFNMQAEGYLEK